ncbi:unnamed protein product, partial [Candidula unifasciata]
RRRNTKDDREQTLRRFQSYKSDRTETVKSNTVSTMTDTCHENSSVRNQYNNQYSTDNHQVNVGGGYYNFVPSISETPAMFSGHDSPMTENTQKYQEHLNDVPASNNTALAVRPEKLKYDKHTN